MKDDIYCSVCGTEKGYEASRKKSKMLCNGEWVCSLKCWKDYALTYFDYPLKERRDGSCVGSCYDTKKEEIFTYNIRHTKERHGRFAGWFLERLIIQSLGFFKRKQSALMRKNRDVLNKLSLINREDD